MISYRQADIFDRFNEQKQSVLWIGIDEDYILATTRTSSIAKDIGWTIPVCFRDVSNCPKDLMNTIDAVVIPGAFADNPIEVGEVVFNDDGWQAVNFDENTAKKILPDMKHRLDEKLKQAGIEFQSSIIVWPAHAIEYRLKPMQRQADLFERIKPKAHVKHERVNLLDLRKDVDVGRKVIYIPQHANGDWYHEDSQMGRITSWNHKFVFVNFGKGDTSAACDPNDIYWCFDYPAASDSKSLEKNIGTMYMSTDNLGNMRWVVNPDGYKDSIKFILKNPQDVMDKKEHKRIPISFSPEDQFCRYEP